MYGLKQEHAQARPNQIAAWLGSFYAVLFPVGFRPHKTWDTSDWHKRAGFKKNSVAGSRMRFKNAYFEFGRLINISIQTYYRNLA